MASQEKANQSSSAIEWFKGTVIAVEKSAEVWGGVKPGGRWEMNAEVSSTFQRSKREKEKMENANAEKVPKESP